MSGRREDIVNSEWTEELLPFSADGKLLAIWSRTNRHMGLSGLCRVAEAAIRFETGMSPKRLQKALDELQRASYLRYDEPVLFVPSRTGRLSGVNPNMARSMASDLRAIGPHPYRVEFLRLYQHNTWFERNVDLCSLYQREVATVAGPSGNRSGTYRDRDGDSDRDAA